MTFNQEFKDYLGQSGGMENKIQMRKEPCHLKESSSEIKSELQSHAIVIGRHSKTHLVKDGDHNITVEIEIKEEPVLCETPVSDLDNETASVFSYSDKLTENVSGNEESPLPITEVEIKEEPWWLESTAEVKCDTDNSSLDTFEQNEGKVEINGFVRREKNPHTSPGSNKVQPCLHPLTPLTASSKRRRKQDVDKREQEIVIKSLSMIAKVEEKDECSLFGQFVASELRSLQRAPKLQIKLKNLIQKSIIEVTSEYAQKVYKAVPTEYV